MSLVAGLMTKAEADCGENIGKDRRDKDRAVTRDKKYDKHRAIC